MKMVKIKKKLKKKHKPLRYSFDGKKKKIKILYNSVTLKKLDLKAKQIKKQNVKKFKRNIGDAMGELIKLDGFLKKLDKKLARRLKTVKDKETITLAKYLIISKLKEIHLALVNEFGESVRDYRKEGTNIDYIRHLLSQMPSKIRIFKIDFNKEEFKKMLEYIDKLKMEIKNV